jgi:hypothetical protein
MPTCQQCNSVVTPTDTRCPSCFRLIWRTAGDQEQPVRTDIITFGDTGSQVASCQHVNAINRPIVIPEKENTFLLVWDWSWAAITAMISVFLIYWGVDFVYHPRAKIPDPSKDIVFGFLLLGLSLVFIFSTLANLRRIPFTGMQAFVAGLILILLTLHIYALFWGTGSLKFVAWFVLIVVYVPAIINGLLVLHSFIQAAARNGENPSDAAEDTLALLSSKSWWHYLMYKNTRRDRQR